MKDGFSLGLSFVVGIPQVISGQLGVSYNIKNKDFSASLGATAFFNTAYVSASTTSGFSTGWSFGISPQSGSPISTNFTSVGANYNITHNSWSGNISAWGIDRNGWSFNPGMSIMICPEQTTNLVRGQGFKSNQQVFEAFEAKGKSYRPAMLKYFGFEGEYVDSDWQSSFWNNKESGEYGIRYRNGAFESYDALLSTYTKESFHMRRYIKNGFELATGSDDFSIVMQPEERLGVIQQYKNQGLYWRDKYNYLGAISNVEGWIDLYNSSNIYNPNYSYSPYTAKWWHLVYKIPRLW
jgi:hypothetical protein